MNERSALTLLSLTSIIVVSLMAGVLADFEPLWVLGPALASLLVGGSLSIIHHGRVHRSFFTDAMLIASSFSLALFTGIMTLLAAGASAQSFSSVDPYMLVSVLGFVVGVLGLFVFQFAYAYRFEAKRRMLFRSLIGGFVLGMLGMIILHVSAVGFIEDQYDLAREAELVSLNESPSADAYHSLEGTALFDAVSSFESSVFDEHESRLRALSACEGLLMDTLDCGDQIADTTVSTVKVVITSLLLQRFVEDAMNATPTPLPLSTAERALLGSVAITRIDPNTEAYRTLESQQTAILSYDARHGSAIVRSINTLIGSTRYADSVEAVVNDVLVYTTHVGVHLNVMVPALLLEADPTLADDSLFIALARERIEAHAAQE